MDFETAVQQMTLNNIRVVLVLYRIFYKRIFLISIVRYNIEILIPLHQIFDLRNFLISNI